MSKTLILSLCATLFLAAGCNLIYKQNIQQGNALEQEDLDQLELGMSKNQVSFLLGTPAIHDPFHHDRWDYISTFSRRGNEAVRRLVTLRFENDRLVAMQGVNPRSSEEVLADRGPEAITPSASLPGVSVEDARTYDDLALVPEHATTWSIQAGAFTTRLEADGRLRRLEAAGIPAEVMAQVIGGAGLFVVRSGQYESREAALAAMDDIEERTGLRPFLVSPGN